jgi:hypothetical protein
MADAAVKNEAILSTFRDAELAACAAVFENELSEDRALFCAPMMLAAAAGHLQDAAWTWT